MGGAFFIVLTIGIILLFLPIQLDVSLHYDMNRRKFTFGIYVYKLLKIIGGYIATYAGGFALHVSEKKAILMPYNELNNERKRFSFLRFLRLKKLKLSIESGAEYLMLAILGHMIARGYYYAIGGKREKIANNLLLVNGDELKICFHCSLFFNLFMVIYNLIIFLKEKVKSVCRKNIKKSTT